MLVERIDDYFGEIASGDLFGEEHVEFVVGAVPGFGESVLGPDEHAEAGSAPDETVGS